MKRFYFFPVVFLLLASQLVSMDAWKSEWLKQGVFAQRRQALMQKMDGGVAIFRGANFARRNRDINYPFRQENNFFYLTGFEERSALFLLIPGAKKQFIMFVVPHSFRQSMWTGHHDGVEEAKKIYGADEAYPVDTFDKMLRGFLKDKQKIYCSLGDDDLFKKVSKIAAWQGESTSLQVVDVRPLLSEMRLIKSKEELSLMQKAVDITAAGHREVMKAVKPGMYEYDMAAILTYVFRKSGAPRDGCPHIVASGPNAAVLHHESYGRRMKDGDLLLVDTGAEYGYYSADISRTFPVNGTFSPVQKEIYNIVLKAQEAAINKTAPGAGMWEVRDAAVQVLTDELFRLGMITDKKQLWQTKVWSRITWVNHWLGMDIHDVGDYRFAAKDKKGRILEPGMVFTIEPGLYIDLVVFKHLDQFAPPGIKKKELEAFIEKVKPAAEKYANVSVRIEDDLLVTEKGVKILSGTVPKTVEGIEMLMKQGSPLTGGGH
jgi:Xaa-Pro aminopeptidase